MIAPGPANRLSDVPGIRVGNAEDHIARSGVTVVLPARPAVAAVDVRGGGPGTRETDVLAPGNLLETVDAVVLSGGSAFGLEAASGVMAALVEDGRGFPVAQFRIPIVPGAILFDLLNGGDKHWGDTPPYRQLGYRAARAATADFALGNAGAGLGAVAGGWKGGLGSASLEVAGDPGYRMAALAAVNAMGSPVMPGSQRLWAWPWERGSEFGGQQCLPTPAAMEDLDYAFSLEPGQHTTLCVVATDLPLTRTQAQRLAVMAHDGLARALRPVHTPFDGDVVFVLATGEGPAPDAEAVAQAGMLAADCVTRAVARGVVEAETLGAFPGYRATVSGNHP